MLPETVLFAKSLLSEYALPNSFLYKCFKLPVSLNFWISSQCLVNGLKAL